MKNLLIVCIGLSIFLFMPTFSWSQGSVKELTRAFESTFRNDVCYYSILYKRLKSNGDTITRNYDIALINNAQEFSVNTQFNDSIGEVYFDEMLLTANLKQGVYSLRHIEKKNLYSETNYLFRPMIDQNLADLLLDNSTVVEIKNKIADFCEFTITPLNPGDLDYLVYSVEVPKNSKTINKFSYTASIAGIMLWESWELLEFEICQHTVTGHSDNRNRFFDYLKNLKPKCDQNIQFEINSNKNVRNISIHDTLPFLQLISIDGDTIRFSDFGAQYILVDYWYRACFPCIKSIPAINELHDLFVDSKLKIVSINSIDRSIDLIHKFVIDNNIQGQIFTSTVEKGREFMGITSFPTFVLYNNKFEVVKLFSGYSDDFRDKIVKIIESNQ